MTFFHMKQYMKTRLPVVVLTELSAWPPVGLWGVLGTL